MDDLLRVAREPTGLEDKGVEEYLGFTGKIWREGREIEEGGVGGGVPISLPRGLKNFGRHSSTSLLALLNDVHCLNAHYK